MALRFLTASLRASIDDGLFQALWRKKVWRLMVFLLLYSIGEHFIKLLGRGRRRGNHLRRVWPSGMHLANMPLGEGQRHAGIRELSKPTCHNHRHAGAFAGAPVRSDP